MPQRRRPSRDRSRPRRYVPGVRDSRPDLVIFDCDGVLVDSEPTSNRVLAAAVSAVGLDMGPEEAASAFEGMRLDEIAVAVEARLGIRLPADWITEFENRRAAEFRRGLTPIPGSDDALRRIRLAGTDVCVASQASREKTELTLGLTGLAVHFEPEWIFSSRMVVHGKPDPDLFLLAATAMGHDPCRCVVVEDGVPGARAGRAAGMRVLGFAPSPARARALGEEGAETFNSMARLPALVGIDGI